jgi:hypothetical protein
VQKLPQRRKTGDENRKQLQQPTRQGIFIQVLPLPIERKGLSMFEGVYYVTLGVKADAMQQL